MSKIVDNIIKCHGCGSYIQYESSDITEKEMSYGVQSYAGETYIAKIITCPKCGKKIEIY
jgi:transcription elongation factor Elf1